MNIKDLEGYAPTLLRLALGSMFIAHGLLKLMVFTIAGTAGFLESQGYPAWVAGPLTYGEIIGGILLIAGFQTRLVALALTPVLIGAFIVHIPNGWLFSAEGGGWEYPLYLIINSVVLVLLGGGKLSISKKDVLANAFDRK